MPVIRCTEPVVKARIDVIVGTGEELEKWYHSHGRKDFHYNGSMGGHGNRLKNDDGAFHFVAWFLCTDHRKGVALHTVVHECFHLYAYVCGVMQDSEYFSINSTDNEDDAYHFTNLFEEVEHAVQKGVDKMEQLEQQAIRRHTC